MNILDRIFAAKVQEVAARRAIVSESEIMRQAQEAPAALGFRSALVQTDGLALIADVQKASPSKGVLRNDLDNNTNERSYAAEREEGV